VRLRSVPEKNLLHSLYCGVVVAYKTTIRGVEPCLKTSVHENEHRLKVSFDSRRAVSHWLLEHGCNVLCIRATVIRDSNTFKIT
jgi:hypothetical protein